MARGRRQGAGSAVLTSLPLEILLYFGGWYDVIFWLIELLVFIYKGFELPYTKSAFGIEFSFVFLYLVIEPIRLFLGAISKTRTYTHARTHARTYGIIIIIDIVEEEEEEEERTTIHALMKEF